MKVLTLWQPWASLVALGVKTIETRSWSTRYRGPLAIHAAKYAYKNDVGEWCAEKDVDGVPILVRRWSGAAKGKGIDVHLLPLGAIVATCTLTDVVPILATGDGPSPLSGGWVRVGDTVLGLNRGGPDDHLDFIDDQLPYGLFESGRYAWLLADVVPVDPPVPFRGGQGLTRTWDPEPRPTDGPEYHEDHRAWEARR